MDELKAIEIKRDFCVWSGGFPPESDWQISVYIETAKSIDLPDEELRHFLQAWLTEDWPCEHDE